MLFTEGTHAAKITSIKTIRHRFKEEHENAFEVKVEVVGEEEGEEKHATCYLPLSRDFSVKDRQKTEAQDTCQTLAALGVPHAGKDLSKLDQLVGREVEIFGKKNNKGYLNFYLNTGIPEKEVPAEQVQKELDALWGTGEESAGNESQSQSNNDDGDDIPF